VVPFICCHDFAGPTDSHQCLKNVSFWVICLLHFESLPPGYWFCLHVNQIRPAKSCSCLVSFVKVASGRFFVTYLYYMKYIQNKREILSGLFPACQQVTVTLGFRLLLILIDYFASFYWNEEIVESSERKSRSTIAVVRLKPFASSSILWHHFRQKPSPALL